MEKKQEAIEKLLTGSLNLKDKSDSNSLYLEISNKLSSNDKEDNAKGVAAVLKVEELTGKEPEFEAPTGTGIKRCLGQDIRDGLVTPSNESENIYKLNKNEPLPGKKDLSDQEIGLRDVEMGFKAAGYESGMKPSSKDKMALDMLDGGAQDDKLNPAPFGDEEKDMTFGPSKIIKGLLTQDLAEVKKGLEQATTFGDTRTFKENLIGLSQAFAPLNQLSKSISQHGPGFALKETGISDSLQDIFGNRQTSKGPPLDLDSLRESLVDFNNRQTELVGEIADAFKTGKIGDEINSLIDVSKNGSLEDVENHVEQLFGKIGKKLNGKEDGEQEQDEDQEKEQPGASTAVKKEDEEEQPKQGKSQEDSPNWSEQLAGRIAGATTYKAGRSKGLNPKKAGELGSIAQEDATDIAKSTKDNEQSKDKSVDMAKDAKNMMAKSAANIASKIPAPPGLGKAIAVGIIIADKATDFLMDLINNKGGLDALNKAGGSLEGAEKEKNEGGIEVFKQEMKKTKGGMVKRLIPTTDDIASTAKKAAVDGVMSYGKDQVKGSKKPVDDVHRQLDQPA